MGINFKKEEKHESILNKYSKLDKRLIPAHDSPDDHEGETFINISPKSKSELGRMLSPGYSSPFQTFLGKVCTIKGFMTAINTPEYPLELLKKPILTPKDMRRIPTNVHNTSLANYWALVAYAFCQKVKASKTLKSLLGQNKLDFIVYRSNKGNEFFGKVISVNRIDYTLAKYVAIIRCVQDLIKENKFTDEYILEFIENCKDNPDKDLLEGIAINLSISDKVEDKSRDVVDTVEQTNQQQVSDESSELKVVI